MSGLDTTPAVTTPAAEWSSQTLAAIDKSIVDPHSPLSGATAQTSGFAQAGGVPSSSFPSTGSEFGRGGLGGGLASSPNVPAPGSSIDPSTGKPHVAGLTRQELAELKAQSLPPAPVPNFGGGGLASSPNVPVPGTTINPDTGKLHTAGITRAELAEIKAHQADDAAGLEQLSGREQAARQLAGVGAGATAASTMGGETELSGAEQAARQLASKSVQGQVPVAGGGGGALTPGLELPGGWGHVKPVPAPGTGPNATSSIYDDVAEGLNKVGHAAYAAIPEPIKDALSTHQTHVAGSTTGTSTTGVHGGAAGLLDQAKIQVQNVVAQVEEKLGSTHLNPKLAAERTPGTAGSEGSVISQVQGLFAGVMGTAAPAGALGTNHASTAVAPATSLPSNETAGALPGQHSSGVGALPGSAGEAGVAVLPLEKGNANASAGASTTAHAGNIASATSLPSNETAGALPGQHSAGVGALPGPAGETGVAVLPLEKNANLDVKAGSELPSGVPAPLNDSRGSTSPANAVNTASTTSSGYSGLEAALPQTNLGLGADHGATDVGLTKSSATPFHDAAAAAAVVGAGAGAGTAAILAHHSVGSELSPSSATGNARDTRHSADRTTSMASVTAIRGGNEGATPTSGSQVIPEGRSGLTGSPPNSTATDLPPHGANTVSNAVSLTPGDESQAVGHPSTRGQPGTEREVGKYPAADLSGAASTIDKAANHNLNPSSTASTNSAADLAKSGTSTTTPATTVTSDGAHKPFPDTTEEPLDPTVRLTGGATGVAHKDNVASTLQDPAKPTIPDTRTSPSTSSPATAATTPVTPTAASSAQTTSGHTRTDSGASDKKKGLFSKIKDKLKNHN